MPRAEAARSATTIRSSTCVMKWPPNRISVNLTQGEGRQVFPFPSMISVRYWIFSFLKVSSWRTWRIKVEATSLIRWWGSWPHLSQPSMIAGSSSSRHNRSAYSWWTTWLLKICLKSLNSVTSPSYTSRIRRYHWWGDWTSSSGSRTAKAMHIKIQISVQKQHSIPTANPQVVGENTEKGKNNSNKKAKFVYSWIFQKEHHTMTWFK